MLHELYTQLDPLCRRERSCAMLTRIAQGLTVGAALALVIGLVGWSTASSLARTIGFVVLGAGLIVGVIAGMCVGKDWVAAARAVDRHFGLADRTLTALACAAAAPPRPIDQLQVRDTVARLQKIDPRDAMTTAFPWPGLVTAAGVAIVAVILLLACGRGGGASAGPPRIDESVFQRPVVESSKVSGRLAEISLDTAAASTRNDIDHGRPQAEPIGDVEIRRYFQAASVPSE